LSRINTFVILFLAFIAVLLSGVWVAVQSEDFARIVSQQITNAVAKNNNTKISFSHLEIGIFPPSTSLKNTKLEYEDENIGKIILEGSNLEIKFSLLNFMTSNIQLNQLSLVDGYVKYTPKRQTKLKKDIKSKDIYFIVKDFFQNKLPFEIENVNLSEIQFFYGKDSLTINSAELNVYKSLFELSANIYSNKFTPKLSFLPNLEIDELAVKLQITKEKTWIKNISLMSNTEKITFAGELDFSNNNISVKGESVFQANLSNVADKYLNIKKIKSSKGYLQIKTKINGDLKNPNMKFDITGDSLETEYGKAKSIHLNGEIKDQIITIQDLEIKTEAGKGYAKLLNTVKLFSITEKKFLKHESFFKVNKIKTNEALYVLDDVLKDFKGNLTGNVGIAWNGSDVIFNLEENFILENFKLLNTEKGKLTTILENKRINLAKSQIIIMPGLDVGFDLSIDQEITKMKFKGLVTNSGVQFQSEGGTLDVKDLGAIAGVDVEGIGNVNVNIYGNFDDVHIDLETDVSGFSVIGIYLGQLKSKLEFSLNDLLLKVVNASGDFENTVYESSGFLNFKNDNINLNSKFIKSTYSNSINIFKGLLKNIPHYPKNIRGNIQGSVKVVGKMGAPEMKVIGNLKGQDFRYLDEDFETLSIDFSYVDDSFDVSNIAIAKGSGHLSGQFSYNNRTEYFEYDSRVSGLQLDDINFLRLAKLGVTGELLGEFYGNGTKEDFSTRSHIRLANTLVGNKRINDSIVTIFNNSTDLFISGNALGERGKFNMFINLDRKKKQNSYINAFFNSTDPNVVFGVLSQHNVVDRELKGKIAGKINSSFSVFDIEKLNLDVVFTDLNLQKGPMHFTIKPNNNFIKISGGEIVDWDIQIHGPKDVINSKASGVIKNGIVLEQSFNLNAKILEIISPTIERSFGRFKANNKVKFKPNEIDNNIEVMAEDLSLKIRNIPGVVSNVKFNVLLDGKNLRINELIADYGKGKVMADGLIRLAIPYPKADLTVTVNESNIPLFKKSGVVISANTKIYGNKFPYHLDGQVRLVGGSILDNVEDIKGKQAAITTHSKYIPLSVFEKKVEYVDLNLDVDFIQPLRVKNNFTDLQLTGEGKLRGVLSNPVINGKMDVVSGISKFLFKGHEFIIQDGNIRVFGDESLNPSLNFIALAEVDKYDVKLSVGGTANQLTINLESEPYLSKEDILSLLTLGYTADISKNLKEKDRQSVTTIGLGTLIVDQLRLNEGLNSSLGLKLSVLPEFSENDESLLQGKSAVLDSASTGLKSATKVKLQKKISKKVDLSVSSTVGGSLEQKQEMNLNFNINRNLSVEGVYEVRSSTEDDSTQQDPESVGADVKYKWTF
jgi:translocation and assembly module TamB